MKPLLAACLALAFLPLACADKASEEGKTAADGGVPVPDAGGPPVTLVPASKVDLLIVVDNSAAMAEKASKLGDALGGLLRDVSRVGDLHVAVVTTSLGPMGGDVCHTPEGNGMTHLRDRSQQGPVASAATGVISFTKGGDIEAVIQDTKALVTGVGEAGCGFEAQLETVYRFLVQPDPWTSVVVEQGKARFEGIDEVVLAQRKAFLRPDSALVVVLVTDEDDSSVDPLSLNGQGWAYANTKFPGSNVVRADGNSTTAPRATSACATNPLSPDCTSCAFGLGCDAADTACLKIKADPECQKNGGFYGPSEDALGVRFHRMKQRYGVDPQFPLSRYVDGLTNPGVPNRPSEHAGPNYVGKPTCTNPIFAAQLPGSSKEELCALPPGTRSRDLVLFALVGGLPEALATASPEWTKILGKDPATFDLSGIDPHMLQSTVPRPGLAAPVPTRGDNGSDPVHGREWTTNGTDLQYACTFPLASPKTCSAAEPSCDCATPDLNPPICGPSLGQQSRGRAVPTIRELRLVQALGDRAVVGSACSASYDATMKTLSSRLASRLAR